jgi:hypothetical protein
MPKQGPIPEEDLPVERQVQTRMSAGLYRRVDDYCHRSGLSLTELLRRAVAQFIGDGTEQTCGDPDCRRCYPKETE